MSAAVAEAASTMALQAEAAALGITVRELVVSRARANIERRALEAAKGQGLPARTWAEIPLRTRLVLVMLGCSDSKPAEQLCRQGWEAFGDSDRAAIAAAARELSADLKFAASLF